MIQNFKYQRNIQAHLDINIETVSDELDNLPLDERTKGDCSQLLEIFTATFKLVVKLNF